METIDTSNIAAGGTIIVALVSILRALAVFLKSRAAKRAIRAYVEDTDENKSIVVPVVPASIAAPPEPSITTTQLSDALKSMTAMMQVTVSMNTDLQLARASLTAAQTEIEASRQARLAAETHLRAQIDDMNTRLSEVERERNKLSAEIADLRGVLKARDERERVAAEEQQAKMVALEAQLQTKNEEIARLQSELADLRAKLATSDKLISGLRLLMKRKGIDTDELKQVEGEVA